MTSKSLKSSVRRLASLCFTAVFAAFLALPALAVPEEFQYVLDSAGVLSQETEEDIIRKNQKLFRETGAEIAVVAVDFLDGKPIEDYTYQLFNQWGVGSQERNNGFLLVMAIAEETYYLQSGSGVEDVFDGAKLDGLLQEYLEPDFAAGNYDAGAQKLFNALYKEVELYHQSHPDLYDQPQEPAGGEGYPARQEPASGLRRVLSGVGALIMRVVLILVAVVIFFVVIRAFFGGGRGGPRNGGGGGGFWRGMWLGSMMSRRRTYWTPPPPPRPGGFGGAHPPSRGGGFGGLGGFSHGGRPGNFGGGRSGGFSRGGSSRGGGAGRR